MIKFTNPDLVRCSYCQSYNVRMTGSLRVGRKYVCEDCCKDFIDWIKGADYRGNYEFNEWYNEDNKEDLYNFAKNIVDNEINNFLAKKENWSDDYKVIAFNIIIENMRMIAYGELNLKELEDELSTKMGFKGYEYNFRTNRKNKR